MYVFHCPLHVSGQSHTTGMHWSYALVKTNTGYRSDLAVVCASVRERESKQTKTMQNIDCHIFYAGFLNQPIFLLIHYLKVLNVKSGTAEN